MYCLSNVHVFPITFWPCMSRSRAMPSASSSPWLFNSAASRVFRWCHERDMHQARSLSLSLASLLILKGRPFGFMQKVECVERWTNVYVSDRNIASGGGRPDFRSFSVVMWWGASRKKSIGYLDSSGISMNHK
jgi:hypothetical protein